MVWRPSQWAGSGPLALLMGRNWFDGPPGGPEPPCCAESGPEALPVYSKWDGVPLGGQEVGRRPSHKISVNFRQHFVQAGKLPSTFDTFRTAWRPIINL